MKKILVAVDVARDGGNDAVMRTARELSDAMGGELILLHVVEPLPGYIHAQIPNEALAQRLFEIEKELKDLAERYKTSELVIREGAASTEILEYADSIHADLIVLHSHDPGISDYFLGSVAGRVVRHAHCSVHVVRQAEGDS